MLPFRTQPLYLSHSLFRDYFTSSSGSYKKLGHFDYGQPSCTTDHIRKCIQKDNKWIYIGEVKEGTNDTPHGIGIKVWSTGDIREGYWKDDTLNGRGRTICNAESYYIGEYKEDFRHGEGIYYYKGGDWYKGGFMEGSKYGQGTYYTKDGDKYTGIWDDNYEGQGEINYKDGKKYIGHWEGDYDDGWIIKWHGLGTLYSADGSVLNQGKWEKGEYKGKE